MPLRGCKASAQFQISRQDCEHHQKCLVHFLINVATNSMVFATYFNNGPEQLHVTSRSAIRRISLLIIPNASTHQPSPERNGLRRGRRATHIQCCPRETSS